MALGTNTDRLMSDINVTPFVDVMLVLLIIFMVTAPMMMQGVDVDLPQTTSESLETEKKPLILSIDKHGQVFINDMAMGMEQLGEKLTHIMKNRQDRTVYLRADRDIPYGTVVQVMAATRSAGVESIGMVTDPNDFAAQGQGDQDQGNPDQANQVQGNQTQGKQDS
jgi:biopolymer transport protein TolR